MSFTDRGAALSLFVASFGLAGHAARADYLYVSVSGVGNNVTIFQISPTGSVTDLADSSTLPGLESNIGSDGSGNLYEITFPVPPQIFPQLLKLGHGQVSVVAPVFDEFNELLTADHAGNVYVRNVNLSNVSKIDPNGVISVVASQTGVTAGAADQNGNLFVSGFSGNKSGILEIAPSGSVTVFSTAVSSLSPLAVDSSDDAFAYKFDPSFSTASLVKITPQGNLATLFPISKGRRGWQWIVAAPYSWPRVTATSRATWSIR